jgi:hypothetical protein
VIFFVFVSHFATIEKMISITRVLWLVLHTAALLDSFVLARQTNSNGGHEKFGQRYAMEPQDQTAIVGSRVTLPCRVVAKVGIIQWTKNGFGLGQHRNISGYERYSMVGSDEEGDFSLDIFPVMLDDDAEYQCQVSPAKREFIMFIVVVNFWHEFSHLFFSPLQDKPVCARTGQS